MDGESEDMALVSADKAVRWEYTHGHTIFYRSRLENNRWTNYIGDIVEILDGELSKEKTLEIFKKYRSY